MLPNQDSTLVHALPGENGHNFHRALKHGIGACLGSAASVGAGDVEQPPIATAPKQNSNMGRDINQSNRHRLKS
jgi:hypothetical protein